MTPREAFETLGLPLTATPLEAKAAWRTLARTLHSVSKAAGCACSVSDGIDWTCLDGIAQRG